MLLDNHSWAFIQDGAIDGYRWDKSAQSSDIYVYTLIPHQLHGRCLLSCLGMQKDASFLSFHKYKLQLIWIVFCPVRGFANTIARRCPAFQSSIHGRHGRMRHTAQSWDELCVFPTTKLVTSDRLQTWQRGVRHGLINPGVVSPSQAALVGLHRAARQQQSVTVIPPPPTILDSARFTGIEFVNDTDKENANNKMCLVFYLRV